MEETSDKNEQAKKFGQVVAKAWTDPDFKKRLLSDPKEVLSENGVDVRGASEVHMHENTGDVLHLVLPAKPAGISPGGAYTPQTADSCVVCECDTCATSHSEDEE